MRAPRVLIVMREDWPRALLRAKLRDRGYGAVAAPDLANALVFPVYDGDRGSIRLLILDQGAVDAGKDLLDRVVERHRGIAILLLASPSGEVPPGPWTKVVRSLDPGHLARAVQELAPLRPAVHKPGEA